MADNMFASSFVGVGGKRKYTVLVSIVAHTLAIAAAIIVPLVATDNLVLPTRLEMIAFPTRPPLPPSPSPPRSVTREQLPVPKSTVPIEAPPAIVPEIPIRPSEPFVGLESSTGLVQGVGYSPAQPSPPPA